MNKLKMWTSCWIRVHKPFSSIPSLG